MAKVYQLQKNQPVNGTAFNVNNAKADFFK